MDRSPAACSRNSLFRSLCISTVFLVLAPCVRAQGLMEEVRQQPKIRAITAFINLDRAKYRQQIAETLAFLRSAKEVFRQGGYEVQTIRITTQPFPQYTQGMTPEQAVAFFKEYDALAAKEGFDASIGPAMLNEGDTEAQADLLGEILRQTKILNGSVAVAGEDGVRWNAVAAAARVIKKLSETSEHSQKSFNFAATAMVPPFTPFYPASYHTGFGRQFALALQSANTVTEVFRNTAEPAAAQRKLTERLANFAFAIQALAEKVDAQSGWTYMGIDLSPAPLKDVSIGEAIENLTSRPFGAVGTLTAAAAITAAIKNVGVKQVGYTGLMLPVLEDARLAKRWSEGRITIDALLAYSAVCGTGLDTVPLPGDTTLNELTRIIGDMASLAVKWHKPLSARLLPVAGKLSGQMTEFDDPFLVNATIQPLSGEPKP